MEFQLLLIFASIFSIPYGILSVIHSAAHQLPFLVHSFRGTPNNGNYRTADGILAFQKLGNKVLKLIQTEKKQNMEAQKIMITSPKMAMNGRPNDGKMGKKEPRIINEENKSKLENLFSMNGIGQIGYDQMGKIAYEEECPFETDKPLVIICGATGTGKSDLAIEIAKKIGGEVISADSMQIYKGLDIATNKVTEIEMNGIPHHLMSFVEPTVPNYDQWQFRNDAIKIIKQIWERQRIPIVAGGSASYFESLIYCKEEPKIPAKKIELHRLLEMFPTGKALYERLMEVDPEVARQILPDNTAKVIRELQFYYSEEMKTESRLKMEAENAEGKTKNEMKFRYKNTLLLYLDTKMRVELKNKLKNRVEKMIKKGLIKELEEYYEKYKNFIGDVNQGWFGGMQTIGLNAFLPYLEMNEQEKMSENGKNIFEKCKIEFQKQDNEYANLQRKNFYEKILQPASHKQAPNVIGLNMSNGFQKIVPFATELVQTFMDEKNFKRIVEMNPELTMEIVKPEKEMKNGF